MFENANTAEEKLQELLKQSNVKDIEDCSEGLFWGIGNYPMKDCIFIFRREDKEKYIRVEVFPSYEDLRKEKAFFERMKNDCLEGGCFERLGRLYDWYENGTKENAPHPADMFYADAIKTIEYKNVWNLEDDEFTDGDIVTCKDNLPFIYAGKWHSKFDNVTRYRSYAGIGSNGELDMTCNKVWRISCNHGRIKPATEEQKKLLFDMIEKTGMAWNKNLFCFQKVITKDMSLKIGEMILVRNTDKETWKPAFFSRYTKWNGETVCNIIDASDKKYSQFIKYDNNLAYK